MILLGSFVLGAQTTTAIRYLEVDGKRVDKPFSVIFQLDERRVPAVNAPGGFLLPPEVGDQEWLSMRIVFDRYDLKFSTIHRSKSNTAWVVGVDNRPSSEEFARDARGKKINMLHYIRFYSSGLDTNLVVTIENVKRPPRWWLERENNQPSKSKKRESMEY